jgi:MoxR-like ATPase
MGPGNGRGPQTAAAGNWGRGTPGAAYFLPCRRGGGSEGRDKTRGQRRRRRGTGGGVGRGPHLSYRAGAVAVVGRGGPGAGEGRGPHLSYRAGAATVLSPPSGHALCGHAPVGRDKRRGQRRRRRRRGTGAGEGREPPLSYRAGAVAVLGRGCPLPGRLAAASPCGKRQILLTDALHIFTLPSMTTKTTKEKISALLAELNTGIYEKKEVMALALLSSIAGESIFLLGPPGVAKSLIARRLKYAYKDGNAFEYLMSRFSTPDEIFGPVSISKLKDEDKYERIVKNYLPSATVVFLDEIWKAGPSIQNTLLTVLNEKIFRNGETEISLPIKALISASNELPAKDEGLEALWDRFLVRLVVEGIEDEEAFNKMISEDLHSYEDTVAGEHKITNDEYKKWNDAIKAIKIPENLFNVIHVIRASIAEHNQKDGNEDKPIYISDRRWRKIIRLLRTSAFLNDRNEVDLMDCFLIRHCLWNEETERDTVYQFVRDAIEKHGYTVSFDFEGIKQELEEFKTEIDEETKFVKDTRVESLENVHSGYYGITGMSANQNLIRQSDFDSLTNSNVQKNLYHWRGDSYNRVERYPSLFNLRKGNPKFNVFINDKEYKLKTTVMGDKRQETKKPHPAVEKDWDGRIDVFLRHTNEWLEQIEAYRQKDLDHLRTNIFVNPAFANTVESHITATVKEIEKLEVAIREIQNNYKKLKDEEVVIK